MVQTYVAYLTLSVLITVWVGHSLHKNGRVFLDRELPRSRGAWQTVSTIYCWSASI